MDCEAITHRVIGCAIEVHRFLAPGLLESVYEECLAYEFRTHGINFHTQVPIGLQYKEIFLDISYRADFIVEQSLLLELKAIERVLPVHHSQVLTYLKLTGLRTSRDRAVKPE